MTREELFAWAEEQYGVQPEFPWADENAVLRRRDNAKWFAAILCVPYRRLGLDRDGIVDVLNVKCDPVLVGALRMVEGYHPAYHMNKDKWLSARLDGSVSSEDLQNLLSLSYTLTGSKKKKV